MEGAEEVGGLGVGEGVGVFGVSLCLGGGEVGSEAGLGS